MNGSFNPLGMRIVHGDHDHIVDPRIEGDTVSRSRLTGSGRLRHFSVGTNIALFE